MVETLKISTLIYVEKRENGAATMFKEIMDGTFPELMKGANPKCLSIFNLLHLLYPLK